MQPKKHLNSCSNGIPGPQGYALGEKQNPEGVSCKPSQTR